MVGALVLFVIAIIAISVAVNSQTTINTTPTVRSQALPTTDPTIIASLEQLPNATPISAEEDAFLGAFRDEVTACNDFSAARRDQMLQHIDWLRDPTVIPLDIALAFRLNASSITGGLVYSMGIYTSTEWRRLERPANSCLIDIGRTVNDMLLEVGESPITIYDEAAE